MQKTDDIQLYAQIKGNDRNAFDVLFRKYYAELVRLAFFYTKSPDIAEEVVQEMFIGLWQNRKKINIHTTVKSYLCISVKNTALNKIKSDKTRQMYESQYTKNISDDQSEAERLEELKKAVYKAIENLPEKCKNIFELSRFDGLTYQEIADYLQISKKTVENQMGIALKKLRHFIKPYL